MYFSFSPLETNKEAFTGRLLQPLRVCQPKACLLQKFSLHFVHRKSVLNTPFGRRRFLELAEEVKLFSVNTRLLFKRAGL